MRLWPEGKDIVKKENLLVSGIYKITNIKNNKSYVGQAVNIYNRWLKHLSTAYNINSPEYDYPLYRAFRKYGENNFTFEILELCEKDLLNDTELFYIDKYKCVDEGYNQIKTVVDVSPFEKITDDVLLNIFKDLEECKYLKADMEILYGIGRTRLNEFNQGERIPEGYTGSFPIRKKTEVDIKKDIYNVLNSFTTYEEIIQYINDIKMFEQAHLKIAYEYMYFFRGFVKDVNGKYVCKKDVLETVLNKDVTLLDVRKKFKISKKTLDVVLQEYSSLGKREDNEIKQKKGLNKLDNVSLEQVLSLLKDNSFRQVGEFLNVSGNAVRKFLIRNSIEPKDYSKA